MYIYLFINININININTDTHTCRKCTYIKLLQGRLPTSFI